MAYIYVITNDINGKKYVGKTEFSIEKRFKEHCRASTLDRNDKRPLYRAMKKYGVKHFSVSLIEETDIPEERESYWISNLGTFHYGYNATFGGDGQRYIDYDEVVSLYQRLKNQKLVASQLNLWEGTVRRILSQNGVRRIKSPTLCKQITQYSLDGEKMKTFESCGDAAKFLIDNGIASSKIGTVRNKITDCANNKRKTAYQFIWKFT